MLFLDSELSIRPDTYWALMVISIVCILFMKLAPHIVYGDSYSYIFFVFFYVFIHAFSYKLFFLVMAVFNIYLVLSHVDDS